MNTLQALLTTSLILLAAASAQAQVNYEPYYFTTLVGKRFSEPRGIVADRDGNIYVAETSGGRLVRIDTAGGVKTLATYKAFNPWGVAIDSADNIYVTHDSSVDKVSPSGAVSPFVSGLNAPVGVAVDDFDNVFIANSGAHEVIKVTAGGTVTTFASGFKVDRSNNPLGVAADLAGNVYATEATTSLADDSIAGAIYKIAPDGTKTLFAGSDTETGSADGIGTNARFEYPTEMGCDKDGNLIVADFGRKTVRKVTPSGIVTTLGGVPGVIGATDGVGRHALFNFPYAANVDRTGRILVADSDNGLIRIGVPASRALNISTRMDVQSGTNVLIGGFIVSGATQKKVLVRALGPSLGQAGISNTLADPVLELHDGSGAVIASDDNWKDKQRAEIEATGIPPTNGLESALVATLNPGNYTAVVSGKNNGTGVGLVEVYDLDQNTSYRLANISTRVLLSTGWKTRSPCFPWKA